MRSEGVPAGVGHEELTRADVQSRRHAHKAERTHLSHPLFDTLLFDAPFRSLSSTCTSCTPS